jgi:hypothetical protein
MNHILSGRAVIYDQFHSSSAGPAYFFKPENSDAYAAYYTSMYLIQDTAEAVATHVAEGFSTNAMHAYLEFWGVMQAVDIQQDAICQLHQAIVGSKSQVGKTSAWWKLRDMRHLCAGHPAHRAHGLPAPQRAFMGRNFGSYAQINYELWDAHTGKRTHPTFDLRQMINAYDAEAGALLGIVFTTMKTNWP